MRQYNTTAIVLRRSQYAETDNILTLFSRERGRLSAIARGARKPISRLSGACEVLTCARFSLATGKNMDVVTQAEVLESYPELHKDVTRLAHGLSFAELLGAFVVDVDPHPELFVHLRRALRLLETANPDAVGRWYELGLLRELGYAPEIATCIICGADMSNGLNPRGTYGLSASQGGALCAVHAHPGSNDDHSALTGDSLLHLQAMNAATERASDVTNALLPAEPDVDQARAAMRRYIRYRLDRDLRSVAFLDSLRFAP